MKLKPKARRRKEIMKGRNLKIENRKTAEKINETKTWFFGKIKLL